MNDSSLKKWALWAEIVSGAAVVITLLFLVVEIRSNTEAVKIDTYDRLVADIATWNMAVATDNELGESMRITETSNNQPPKTEYQNYIESRAVRSLYIIYERAFLQWETGNITDSQFERFRSQICRSREWDTALDDLIRNTSSVTFTEFRDQCSKV